MTQARKALLRVNEFASELDVTVACVRRWILERRIAFVKVGRLVRIPGNEVERVIKAGMHPALAFGRRKPVGREPENEVERIAKEGLGPVAGKSR
jgi:excisionase family DNA binding protein